MRLKHIDACMPVAAVKNGRILNPGVRLKHVEDGTHVSCVTTCTKYKHVEQGTPSPSVRLV